MGNVVTPSETDRRQCFCVQLRMLFIYKII